MASVNGNKGGKSSQGSEWEWIGRVIGVLGILAVAAMAVFNAIGMTPAETIAWVKALPQQAVDKIAGTRCALHPCRDKTVAVPVAGARPAAAEGPYKVVKVTDGDTVHVTVGDKNTTIRILGIDTPETHDPRKPVQCYGPEAAARAHQLLDGKSVYLEYDATQGRADKYGRTLAYVWIGGSIYEQTVLREGFAHEYTYAKAYARQKQFRATEAAAKAAKVGFWAANTCDGNTTQPEKKGTP